MKKVRVVILGAGFAGLRAALDLPKRLKGIPHEITLVDRSDVHLYTPDLYEIATAFNCHLNHECLVRLRDTVATPIRSLVNPKEVNFVQDWVADILPEKKKVALKRNGELSYDILVVALGSTAAYFNIPGLEEHSYALKTIRDALAINSHLDHLFNNLRTQKRPGRKHSEVHITVGGGGPAGVELVAELAQYLNLLCKKYDYPRSRVHVHLVEALGELAGMGVRGTALLLKRLKSHGVITHLNQFVAKVDGHAVHLKTSGGKKECIPCQFLVWTGGVQVNPVVAQSFGDPLCRGAIPVHDTLQSKRDVSVFAAGDNAVLIDPLTEKPLPMMAQFAFLEGACIAKNIENLLRGRPLQRGKFHKPVMIVPVGGRYGVMSVGRWILKGKRVWLLRRLVSLRYAIMIGPFWKALRKWRRDTKVFVGND
jgi:NADH dehydrogenase